MLIAAVVIIYGSQLLQNVSSNKLIRDSKSASLIQDY